MSQDQGNIESETSSKEELELEKLRIEVKHLRRPSYLKPSIILPLFIPLIAIVATWYFNKDYVNLRLEQKNLELQRRSFELQQQEDNISDSIRIKQKELDNIRSQYQARIDSARKRSDRASSLLKTKELEARRQALTFSASIQAKEKQLNDLSANLDAKDSELETINRRLASAARSLSRADSSLKVSEIEKQSLAAKVEVSDETLDYLDLKNLANDIWRFEYKINEMIGETRYSGSDAKLAAFSAHLDSCEAFVLSKNFKEQQTILDNLLKLRERMDVFYEAWKQSRGKWSWRKTWPYTSTNSTYRNNIIKICEANLK